MIDGNDRQRVLAILREQEAAIARGDALGVVAPLAEDVVSYDLAPPLEYRGRAARDTEALEQWFATWEGEVLVQLADPTVFVDGDLAVVHGFSRMRGVKKDLGPTDIWSRRTVVFLRRGEDWRIVHAHESFPMLMDGSQKAALDLSPAIEDS